MTLHAMKQFSNNGVLVAVTASLFLFASPQSRAGDSPQPSHEVSLPGGTNGIGFDGLRYFPQLHRVAIPAGQTGDLDLYDPATKQMTVIHHVADSGTAPSGDDPGDTSVAYGEGYLFTNDHGRQGATIINAKTRKIVGRAKLASDADFVRFVKSRHELWVTEMGAQQIEIFRFAKSPNPTLRHEALISVPGGPEGLVIDNADGIAYANLRTNKTVKIDLAKRKVVATWPNGCRHSRGLALAGRWLFVAGKSGKVVTLDTKRDGKVVHSASCKPGVDIIAYSPKSGHLYVPSARAGFLTVFDVKSDGHLSQTGQYPTAKHAHQVATNGKQAFLGDPTNGSLIIVNDR